MIRHKLEKRKQLTLLKVLMIIALGGALLVTAIVLEIRDDSKKDSKEEKLISYKIEKNLQL